MRDLKPRTHRHSLKKDEVKIKCDVVACIWEASKDFHNPSRGILYALT